MEQSIEMEGGGTLTTRPEGPRVRFFARRPADGRGLYKVWLRGDQGGKLLLGTLVPEGDALALTRTLSLGELVEAGCWPQLRARCVMVFSFDNSRGEEGWICEEQPARLVTDPVLCTALRRSMLYRQGEDGFSLAAPFLPERPFPLVPLFCLARPEQWGGRLRLVWDFDQDGTPRPPRSAP